MKNILSVLVLMSLTFSCAKQEKNAEAKMGNETGYFYDITESDILEIPLDRYTKTFSLFTQLYVEDDHVYLVRLNHNANQLQFYSIDKKTLEFVIKYPRTGPEGVGNIRHFYVHNLDSIFILRAHANTVYLTDSAAIVYESYKIKNEFNGNSFTFLSGFTFSPLIYENGNMYVRSVSEFKSCDQRLYQNNQPTMIKYSLSHSDAFSSISQFPESYKGKNWDAEQTYFISYSYNPDKELFVFSYPASNLLFIRNKEGVLIDSVLCKSDYFDRSESFKGDCQDYTYVQGRHFMETPTYFSIIYDGFRQVYYRIALLPGDVSTFPPDKGFPNDLLSYKIPVIIVLDKNFNKIAEKKLAKDTYLPFDYFVGKEGLYMSVNHDNSKYLVEDKLKFRLLKLTKL